MVVMIMMMIVVLECQHKFPIQLILISHHHHHHHKPNALTHLGCFVSPALYYIHNACLFLLSTVIQCKMEMMRGRRINNLVSAFSVPPALLLLLLRPLSLSLFPRVFLLPSSMMIQGQPISLYTQQRNNDKAKCSMTHLKWHKELPFPLLLGFYDDRVMYII